MAEVDTSSYPKPALPISPLDIAGKLGGLQQQQQQIQSGALTIDKQKLDLANQRFDIFSKQLIPLIDKPDLTVDDVKKEFDKSVQDGLMPAETASKALSQIPPNATSLELKSHLASEITRGQTMMEALNWHLGQQQKDDTGQQLQNNLVSNKPGFGVRNTGVNIQKQVPVTAPTVTSSGQPALYGAHPPDVAPNSGAVAVPPSRLPIAPLPIGPRAGVEGPSRNFGGTLIAANAEPAVGASRGPVTAPPPMFEEGKKQFTADQELATQKLTAIKPALQALPLLNGIMAGPGTNAFTHAVAGLKAFGLIPTSLNDPIAIRQEVVKKLNQYVSSNPVGQRSDAAQTLSEASSPNPNVQILPALKKLTMDAVALDRVQAARSGAFTKTIKNEKGENIQVPEQDFSKYGQHRSTFPANMDERAFAIDMMEPKERKDLITEMKKKKDTFEGKKFWKSLAIVDKQGLIDTGGQ